jgi:lysylphosphatidylglycerol synthetase-like protein (DUF2156 family)
MTKPHSSANPDSMTNADSMAALGLCDDRAVAAVSLLQRRRRQRRISMLVVVVVGVANLAGALYPRLEPHAVRFGKDAPVLVGNGQRLFTIAAGVGLIVLALGLRSAQRRAWTAAVIISALSVLAHISRGLPLVSTALAVALLAWLVATRRAYPASSRPTERRAVLGFVLLSALLVAYGLIEWERHEPGLPHQSLSGRLTVIARGMLFLDPGVQGTTRAARAYLGSLQFAGSLLAAALALVVLRPVLSWRQRHGADSLHRFVQRFGRTSTAPLIELPDNRVLELHDGNTIVGCKIHAGVVISVGDPIARPETAGDALGDFIRWSSDTGRVPVMLGASSALAARAAELGLEADKIGEDARIVLADFSLAGKARANVRHSVTRAEKDAVTARAYTSHDRDRHVDAQLRAISEAWLATKRGPELGFTLGRVDVSRLDPQHGGVPRRRSARGQPGGHTSGVGHRSHRAHRAGGGLAVRAQRGGVRRQGTLLVQEEVRARLGAALSHLPHANRPAAGGVRHWSSLLAPRLGRLVRDRPHTAQLNPHRVAARPHTSPRWTRSSAAMALSHWAERKATSLSRRPVSCSAKMRAANSPALRALSMATVATGTPVGICTIDSSESRPSSRPSPTGTPITGSVVTEANMPGRWAAPPAPAMMIRNPCSAAPLPNSIMSIGIRCAEMTRATALTPNSAKTSTASRMTG